MKHFGKHNFKDARSRSHSQGRWLHMWSHAWCGMCARTHVRGYVERSGRFPSKRLRCAVCASVAVACVWGWGGKRQVPRRPEVVWGWVAKRHLPPRPEVVWARVVGMMRAVKWEAMK